MEAAGYELVLPPKELLSNATNMGHPQELWQWLRENAPKAKSAVIASDSPDCSFAGRLCRRGLFLKRGSDTDPLAPPAACNAPKVKFIVEGAGHGDAMKEAGKGYWQAAFDFLSLPQKG